MRLLPQILSASPFGIPIPGECTRVVDIFSRNLLTFARAFAIIISYFAVNSVNVASCDKQYQRRDEKAEGARCPVFAPLILL